MIKTLGIAALVLFWAAPVAAQGGNKLLERAALARSKGQTGAPVMVYEIADFQCPFCARFAKDVFPRLDSAYIKTGKVQWFFVNLPLPTHGNAWPASEAALCAGATADKFWPMHDRLYATQAEWSNAKDVKPWFDRFARELGVLSPDYQACLAEDRVATLIMQDVIFAASSRVNGTPAFVVNGEQMIVGVKSFDEWKDIIDKLLKR